MHFAPSPMHIPDGFLSLPLAVFLWLVSAVFIAVALRRASRDLDERALPLMGMLAAAIFAGQMLNFPVAGGTSGHLIGAALATILLGPWPAMLVMTSVVVVQALLFQDGGLLALGGNLFNMAVLAVLVSYAVYRLFQRLAREKRWGVLAGGFTAAWISTVAAALADGRIQVEHADLLARLAQSRVAPIVAVLQDELIALTVGVRFEHWAREARALIDAFNFPFRKPARKAA